MDSLLPDVPLNNHLILFPHALFLLRRVNEMDQTNHDTQTDQDRKHDRHIDQHDNERIRRYRLMH